jgi:hypothetical protein
MEYIITDRQKLKIFHMITGYIEEMIDLDTVIVQKEEEVGDEGVWLLMDITDYDNILMIYFEEYWADTVEGKRAKEKSPILVVENNYEDNLNSNFGNLWHEPMKEFVKNNFGIEIKSIGF